MKLKRKGFILFAYHSKWGVESFDICSSMRELIRKWNNEWDDKWDVDGRHKIHYFYLDIAKNKYFPLEKWKNNYDPKKEYEQCRLTVLSTKMF